MNRIFLIQILFISFINFGYSSSYQKNSGYQCEYESGGVYHNCTVSFPDGSWVKGNFRENTTVFPNVRAYFASDNYYIFGTAHLIDDSYFDFRGSVEVEYQGRKYDININSAKDIDVNNLIYLTPKKNTSSISEAKAECKELGFTEGNDSFADCVRQLSGF